jgi:hypothetical protein
MLGIQQYVDDRDTVRLEITANHVGNIIWRSESITSDEYDEQIPMLLEQAEEAAIDILHSVNQILAAIAFAKGMLHED